MTILSLFIPLFLAVNIFTIEDNLTVTYDGEPIATATRADFSIPYLNKTVIDEEGFRQFVAEIEASVFKQPINAEFTPTWEIKEGKNGHKLNREAFAKLFYEYYFGRGTSQIEVPLMTLYPKVDSELLAHIGRKQIGNYITYFNSRNKQRTHNIKLATGAINNYVIFPKETFSFNGVVGKRTKEKGYLSAPIIVKGELSEGVGGGICQVSSTLFNAVDKAGLEIVQRYSHSRRVAYVPPRRDATVSWYGPDFKFKNNQTEPILLRATVHGGSLFIALYSSETIRNQERPVPDAPKTPPKEIEIEEGNP